VPLIRQIISEDRCCLSYIIACPSYGVAVLIDPASDTDQYTEILKRMRLDLKAVIETHIHADHISGARKLSDLSGSDILMHEESNVYFNFLPIKDRKKITLGNFTLEFIHTPGHTQESISILYYDNRRNATEPSSVLTGDTLFVGDVGRCDFSGKDASLQIYESITEKLMKLPDFTEVLPAHYAGSFCGSSMSPKTSSTIGYEKRSNPLLKCQSFSEFKKLLNESTLPEIPDKEKIRKINMGVS
jgi:glyoxylase-like metal-dependent hydrolase (beta-lactamase superfamily II)